MTVLDELERLSKEATHGPWEFEKPIKWDSFGDTAVSSPSGDVISTWDYEGYSSGMYIRPHDADFIKAARQHIDALIQVARAAEGYREANSMCRCKWCCEMDSALGKLK